MEILSGGIGDPANNNFFIPFIFVGSNSTLSKHVALNLEDIPTIYIPANSSPVPAADGNTGTTEPILVSILLCDPRYTISPATVTVTGSALQAAVLPGVPVIGNIPARAANAIFSTSLLDVTSSAQLWSGIFINDIARILFFANRSFEYPNVKSGGTKPLPLDKINQHMNTVLLSSAKAFLSGDSSSTWFPAFETIGVDATGEAQRPALVGSKQFLIALIIVVGALVVLSITLLAVMKADQLQLFDLENIVKTLRLH